MRWSNIKGGLRHIHSLRNGDAVNAAVVGVQREHKSSLANNGDRGSPKTFDPSFDRAEIGEEIGVVNDELVCASVSKKRIAVAVNNTTMRFSRY